MPFEADFTVHLAGDAAIRAYVTDSAGEACIWPVKREEGNAHLPAITHFVVSDGMETDLDGGDGGSINYRVQVDIWARDYDTARTLAELVRKRLEAAGATFNARPLPGGGDDYEPEDDLHHVIREFSCWYDVPDA